MRRGHRGLVGAGSDEIDCAGHDACRGFSSQHSNGLNWAGESDSISFIKIVLHEDPYLFFVFPLKP